ncbi:MAG: hypothetical protein AB1657_00695 [Candidatus Micrarchaeota archaeon]
MARHNHFSGTGAKDGGAVDSGRREFLRGFTGRRGREPEVEMPQLRQPAPSGRGMTRRQVLSGAAGLAGAAALSKAGTGCTNTFVELNTCEGTTVSGRCSYENSAISVCSVSVGNAVEKDGYLFKVEEISEAGGRTRVKISILDKYLDCAEVKSVSVNVGDPQTMVDLDYARYGIAALEASPGSVKLVVARDSGYMGCDGTLSSSIGVINVGEFASIGAVKARLDDVQRDTVDGTSRYSAVIALLDSSDNEIGNMILSEGESMEFPYDASRTYKIEVVEVARGDLLVSKWALISLSMCE